MLYLTSHCHGVYVLNVKTVFWATIKILQDLFIIIHTVRIIVISQSKQLHRNVQEMRQIVPGGNVVGKTGRTVHVYIYILMHSLMPGNAAFIDLLSVCIYNYMGYLALHM